MLSLAYMKDFSVELTDVLKWMLARHSSIMNWGTLCLAYLKDFGVDGRIEEDTGLVLIHHELGHAVLAYLKDFSVDGHIEEDTGLVLVHHELGHAVLAYLKDFSVDGCIKWTLAQYSFIMNWGMLSLLT